jgi:hypothetical protein
MFSDYRLSNYWQRIALPAISPERGRYIERTQISANVEPDGKSPDSGFRTIEQSDRVCRTLSDSVESAPRGQREGPSENMCFATKTRGAGSHAYFRLGGALGAMGYPGSPKASCAYRVPAIDRNSFAAASSSLAV